MNENLKPIVRLVDAAGGSVDGDTVDALYPRRELVCAVKDTLYPAVSTLLHRLSNQFYTKNEKMLCRKKQSILIFCCHNAVNSKTRTVKSLEIRGFQMCRVIPTRWCRWTWSLLARWKSWQAATAPVVSRDNRTYQTGDRRSPVPGCIYQEFCKIYQKIDMLFFGCMLQCG